MVSYQILVKNIVFWSSFFLKGQPALKKLNSEKSKSNLYKAKNHRNYFSHLNINERKKVFEKKQINYAYWKVILTFRLLLLEYLGITYEKNLLIEIIKNINEYKKIHKIRLNVLK